MRMKNSKELSRSSVSKRTQLLQFQKQLLPSKRLKLKSTKRSAWRTSRKKKRKRLLNIRTRIRKLRRQKKSSPVVNKFLTKLREKLRLLKLLKRGKRRHKVHASRDLIFQPHSRSRKVARRLKIKRTPVTIDEYELLNYYIV